MSRTFHFLFSLSPSLLFGLQPVAAQLLPIITKIANGNSVDAVTTENQDEDISNVSSKDVSTSIHFINILKREGGVTDLRTLGQSLPTAGKA